MKYSENILTGKRVIRTITWEISTIKILLPIPESLIHISCLFSLKPTLQKSTLPLPNTSARRAIFGLLGLKGPLRCTCSTAVSSVKIAWSYNTNTIHLICELIHTDKITHTHILTHTHTYIHTYIHMHTYPNTKHTCTHTHTHTHTHIYIHA